MGSGVSGESDKSRSRVTAPWLGRGEWGSQRRAPTQPKNASQRLRRSENYDDEEDLGQIWVVERKGGTVVY